MVTFGTILLGLVVGVHPVSVLVGEGVVAVEIRLDGEVVGVVRGEPWSVECDFGWRVTPHELVAVAFDDKDTEVGRARQLVNVPRPAAEAALMLDMEKGRRLARLAWEAVEGATEPLAIRVLLDGQELVVDDPERIELPPLDEEQLHFLRAELDFTENVSAVVELTFGGFYADQVNTELTALPVLLTAGRELPSVEGLEGWVRGPLGALRVVAAEKGPAEIFLVRSTGAAVAMELWWRRQRGTLAGSMLNVRGQVRAGFVWPHAEATRGRTREFSVLEFSPTYSLDQITLVRLAQIEPQPDYPAEQQCLSDAVAVAGMAATARNRRRAVLLILGRDFEDHSQLRPTEARDYLQQLHVPLFVWAPGGVDSQMEEEWGEVVDVSSRGGMVAAVGRLDRALQAQRILWLDGLYLPNSLALGERASGVTLVAGTPAPAEDVGVLSLQ